EGFLVIGDAMSSFNPIYGQGMTVCALQAEALAACLARSACQQTIHGLSRRYFKMAAQAIETPWALAAGGDFRYPEVEGKRPVAGRVINWYLDRVHRAAPRDPAVLRSFLEVSNIVKRPSALFRPRVAIRVLLGARRAGRLGSTTAGAWESRAGFDDEIVG